MERRPGPSSLWVVPMSQTPISSSVSYLSASEFIALKDKRAIGQLAVDDGTELDEAGIIANTRVNMILMAASGEIESCLLSCDRYFQSDLSQPNGASQIFLKALVADLAMYRLYTARDAAEPPATVLANYDEAQEKLKDLASGARILSFEEAAEAGTAVSEQMTDAELLKLNRFTDARAQVRAMGYRQDRRRVGYLH